LIQLLKREKLSADDRAALEEILHSKEAGSPRRARPRPPEEQSS
jgi:hypothetical protein